MSSSVDGDLIFMRLWAPLKLIAWTLLAAGATLHAVTRRHVRSRGWQLNRILVALCWLFTGAASAQMAVVFDPRNVPVASLAAFDALSDISDATFLALLMVRRICETHRAMADCFPWR